MNTNVHRRVFVTRPPLTNILIIRPGVQITISGHDWPEFQFVLPPICFFGDEHRCLKEREKHIVR